ncbi:DUF202 domain-containing protein [Dactylosporangium roseum]|uniref:DUF202 domain-containing protein n=1 Tax=Dactylosporangium roseum TaxID=47989 RepID=A0ABY5YYC0_9ACTN|nr:DUF202 domain-containing protein [Dactylosporangium roseum]UWZ34733.1 DUF202 domain-containing protein [Dactylosporangium roseum]
MALLDPGLQAERTAIAWTRTAACCLANGVLFIPRYLRDRTDLTVLLLVGLAFALTAATFVTARRRRRTLARPEPPRPATAWPLATLAAGNAVFGVLFLLDLLAHRP